jgi:bifunctional UDP-N-acetylglucosamine pyrophosphorylase/glucosamine-1-phosphate N-acetyltransferase
LKDSTLAEGARARHLSYIGDAEIGERVNVGAGTIFANFDGERIHRAVVGDDTNIGNGSILVAPLTVQKNQNIAHGSVVRAGENGGREGAA